MSQEEFVPSGEVLERMELYNQADKITVAQLSNSHTVLLFFTRYIACPACQHMTVEIAKMYKTLLQHNTVPVLVHRNTIEEVKTHLETLPIFESYQPVIHQLLRVYDDYQHTGDQDNNKSLYDEFQVESSIWRTLFHFKSLRRATILRKRGYRYDNVVTPDKVGNTTRLHAFFLIRERKIVRQFRTEHLGQEPDILRLLDSSIPSFITDQKFVEDFNKNRIFAEQFVDGELFINQLDMNRGKRSSKSYGGCLPILTFLPLDEQQQHFQQSLDLENFTEDKSLKRYFKYFCMREFSSELLLFYDCVHEYKLMPRPDREQVTPRLFHLYFNTDSIFELNVPEYLKSACERDFETYGATVDLFDDILSQVKLNLKDTFRRFQKSSLFQEAKLSLRSKTYKLKQI